MTTDKYDLEFACDPLFRKATAKFDERGAKGLTQNVSRVSHRGLEVVFYSGSDTAANEAPSKKSENPLDAVVEAQHCQQIVGLSQSCLRQLVFEDLCSRKVDDELVDFKHDRLEVPFPTLDLTPFAVSQTSFTQPKSQPELAVSGNPQPAGEDEDAWLSKINNDKTDEELSAFGSTGGADNTQTFDDVSPPQ